MKTNPTPRVRAARSRLTAGRMTLDEVADMIGEVLDICENRNCGKCPINVPDNDYDCGHFIARLVLDAPRDGIGWARNGELCQAKKITIGETR